MSNRAAQSVNLGPAEMEAVYAISRAVAETVEIDKALAQIVRLARPVFIFDNAVLYLYNEQRQELEPAFARAIGRGRSSEADLAWGEVAAQEAYSSGDTYLHHPEMLPEQDRLEQRFYLALPLLVGGQILGSLVFIRFGGPQYEADQIVLARYIGAHVAQVLEHQRLVERITNLETERRLTRLQSDFIATVSHELRTPLGFIKGYSTTLMRQDAQWDDATRLEFLGVIDEEADRLNQLVDNLLDSSKLQAGIMYLDLQLIDLVDLVQQSVGRLRSRFDGLEIVYQPGDQELWLQADPKRMEQVLENLLSNANKYAPGSRVTIELDQQGEDVQLAVADNGSGIPAEHIGHVFKRFYRIPEHSNQARGTGLGLYICDQIARAHGGSIQVQSKPGRGARFTFSLPKSGTGSPTEEG